jgi:hypothetical protein
MTNKNGKGFTARGVSVEANRSRKKAATTSIVAIISIAFVIAALALMPATQENLAPQVPSRMMGPGTPTIVIGYTFDSVGAVLPSCDVNITDVDTGEYDQVVSDLTGKYQYDLTSLPSGATAGDIIRAVANNTLFTGLNQSALPSSAPLMWLNVTVSTAIPEFSTLIVPVIGTVLILMAVASRGRKETN